MTWPLLQTTGCKDEPNIVYMRKSQRTLQHGTQNVKTFDRTTYWTSLCPNLQKKGIRSEPSYKQILEKTNRTCGNRNGHHNTELRTYRHIIAQHKNTGMISNTDPIKTPRLNSGAREEQAVPVSYQIPTVLLI